MPRRGNNLLKEDRKVERILCLWNILMRGRGVTREEIAAKLKVNERTVSRYFADIRGCLAALEESDGIHRRLIHSREEGVYKMINEGGEYLTSGELFAVCKILLSSKAFHKVEMKALLERLLQNLASSEERTEIDEYIKNELFEYAEPTHKNPDMDLLWKITRAIHQHHVIAFDYKKSAQRPAARTPPVRSASCSPNSISTSPPVPTEASRPAPPARSRSTAWTA